MAKVIRRGLIGLEDLSVGSGTFSRATSTGGTQTITKINLSGIGVYGITSVSSTPYSVTTGGIYLVDSTSASITLNLPTAVGNTGMEVVVKKLVAANSVIIDANSTETIDGALTYTLLSINEFIRMVSDGSNWKIIGNS